MKISSLQNPKFRYWRSLLKGDSKEVIVSGRKLVPELAVRQPSMVRGFLRQESHPSAIAGLDYVLSGELFRELDVLGTRSPLLVLQRPEIPLWSSQLPEVACELWLPLGDPVNVGAVLRSAWVLGVDRVVFTREAASPFLPKALRAANGSPWFVPLYQGPGLEELPERARISVVLDLNGENIFAFRWPRSTRLLVGEEGRGVPESLPWSRVTIPSRKGAPSLNAAMAATLALGLWSAQQQNCSPLRT